MNRILFLAMLSCAVLNSCNKAGNVSFTSAYDFTATIPAQPTVPAFDTAIAVSSEININDERLKKCDRASLRSLYLEITEPDGQTFDFSREVRLALIAPGLPEIDVVSASHINPNAKRIDFEVSDKNLAQYIHDNSITIRIKIVLLKGTSNAVRMYGKMVFNAQTGLL